MRFLLATLLTIMLLATMSLAQEKEKISAASTVDGLELPPDQTVSFDEGFVNLQAKCKGEVKWLVVSAAKVKYVTVPQSNSIIISIPPQGGLISVFGVGLVDGKLTDFARTNVTVNNAPNPPPGPTPPPNPPPGPTPPPTSAKLHLTFLVDMNNTTPELAKLLNSESLRKGINSAGHWFRLYDIKSPLVAQKKLDQVVAKVGGTNVLVIQSDDGRILAAQPIPATEQAIFDLVTKITGNK